MAWKYRGPCALRHGIQKSLGSHFGLPSSFFHRMTGLATVSIPCKACMSVGPVTYNGYTAIISTDHIAHWHVFLESFLAGCSLLLHFNLVNRCAVCAADWLVKASACFSNGPVRIRHSWHESATQSSHSVDQAGWQAKMASIEVQIPWGNEHKPH